MPIFARRRLQSMLNDISPYLNPSKARDLILRLENKRPEQVLPAEIETALVWGLSRLGEIEVEPEWFGTGRLPDIYSEFLFKERPAIIEIAAISDVGLSGEEDMRRVAHRICDVASKIKSKSGKHLFFHFNDESGYEQGKYFRRRKIDPEFAVTAKFYEQLSVWLKNSSLHGKQRLIFRDEKTDMIIEWKEREQSQFNFFSPMPSETHSLTVNPLFTILCQKSKQMKNANYEGLRCLLLGDAGSSLLRRLNDTDPTKRRVSGQAIIQNFLSSSRNNIDVVGVFLSLS